MIAGRNVLMLWVQAQMLVVSYFFFLYWLVPNEYVVLRGEDPRGAVGDDPLDKVLVALNLAIEYQLGGSDLRHLSWQVGALGTMQRLLSFASFAIGSIMSAQAMADQIRTRNNAEMFGIVQKDKGGTSVPDFDYTRMVFAGNAVMHVMFAASREARMWDADEMGEKYSVLTGAFMVVACLAIAMDVVNWSAEYQETETVKVAAARPAAQPAAPPAML